MEGGLQQDEYLRYIEASESSADKLPQVWANLRKVEESIREKKCSKWLVDLEANLKNMYKDAHSLRFILRDIGMVEPASNGILTLMLSTKDQLVFQAYLEKEKL